MGLWLKKSDGTVVEINSDGIADAPEDGKQYARQDAAWSEVEAAEVLRGDPTNPPADWATDQLLYDGIEDDGSGGGGPHDHAEYAPVEHDHDEFVHDHDDYALVVHDHDEFVHDHDYLPLTGGTISGDLQVDGNSDLKINVPADFWAPDSGTVFSTLGMLGGTQGSYATSMTANGYRNTGGKWTSLGVNSGSTGAVQISLKPTGTFEVRTAADHPTGAESNPPLRFSVFNGLTRAYGDLQVDGSATVGGKAVSVSGHTHSYSPTNHNHNNEYHQANNGAAGTPGFRFNSSTSSGMYYNASYLGLTFQGAWKLLCYKDYVRTSVPINAPNGSAAKPAFTFQSDTNTGMYRYDADAIGFAAGGKVRFNTGHGGTEVAGPNRGDSDKTWASLQLRVKSENSSGTDSNNSHVGIALWAQRPGIAPMMRVHGPAGEGVGFTNSANSAFIDVFAKGVVIPSASMTKRNIKTVQDDAVISLAEKWLMAEFDRQVGPKSVRLKPEAAVRQAAILDAGEELPPADVADYDSADHDCALDLCDGTSENPCPIIVNHRSEWGGVAEWWGEVAPQQVVFDEEGNATGIHLEQVAATALGAVGALSRRLSSSLDRIDALSARIETLEGN